MVKTLALYTKGRRFEPHRRRFFTPKVVLLSFNKPETVLWTIANLFRPELVIIIFVKKKSKKLLLENHMVFCIKKWWLIIIIIIIIIFCYSPKHCFRLIEGQQYHCWSEKSLGIQGWCLRLCFDIQFFVEKMKKVKKKKRPLAVRAPPQEIFHSNSGIAVLQ